MDSVVLLILLCPEPFIEFFLIGIYKGARFGVAGAVDGETEPFLPAQARPLMTPQIGRDFLPGTQELIALFHPDFL